MSENGLLARLQNQNPGHSGAGPGLVDICRCLSCFLDVDFFHRNITSNDMFPVGAANFFHSSFKVDRSHQTKNSKVGRPPALDLPRGALGMNQINAHRFLQKRLGENFQISEIEMQRQTY
jgi:hypothetical protein